jgi:hypothetical protein
MYSVFWQKKVNFEMLKWVVENGCPFYPSSICSFDARRGHLEILKWTRKKWCRWDSETCAYAVEGGHLEVLKRYAQRWRAMGQKGELSMGFRHMFLCC